MKTGSDATAVQIASKTRGARRPIARMERPGFTNLTNLGSLEEAVMATKLPIVN